MGYLRTFVLVAVLFLLTCGLCWVGTWLLGDNPLFGIVFLLLGTLGVVIAIDWLQAQLFP
ncbi:MAG: hypothetical protein OHK0047_29060 [Leptolyngbyaceae cyanobacterium]|uniref:hypothetical protein n=1 Tax=Leptodesmis sp. TaxID=3100501 RepID=UPI003D119334